MGAPTEPAAFGPTLHPAAENLSRDALTALQLQRLRTTLRNAWDHVPWQRARMREAGLQADDLRELTDLHALPFTVKTDLRDHYPFGLFARPVPALARMHASSGTTGRPTVVGYTAGDLDRWADLMARSLYCAGVRPGDLVHNAYGYGLFTGGLGAHDGATRLGCPVVPLSGGGSERQVALIMDFHPRVLCATPSYALALAEVAEQQGVDLHHSGLAIGMFGAEPWSAAMRARSRPASGCGRWTSTACRRSWARAWPANARLPRGLHGWEDHFLFEVIDPETGAVPDGEAGELVITTLTKEALPMLRYRTRDITRADARALRLRAHARAHPARDRAQRRHADHPRRQRLSVADRGGAGRTPGPVAALPAGGRRARRARRLRIEVEAEPGVPQDRYGAGGRGGAPRQVD
jgi:phenylacetate-CoA ligase